MVAFNINGKQVSVNAEPDTPLLWAIRDHLSLTGTKVTDEGMAALAGYSRLTELWIDRTSIGDKGLERLKRLKGLKRILARDCPVTLSGVVALTKAIPLITMFAPPWPKLMAVNTFSLLGSRSRIARLSQPSSAIFSGSHVCQISMERKWERLGFW
mgnify:CR=1 FL=1